VLLIADGTCPNKGSAMQRASHAVTSVTSAASLILTTNIFSSLILLSSLTGNKDIVKNNKYFAKSPIRIISYYLCIIYKESCFHFPCKKARLNVIIRPARKRDETR
jgi:hypothetical protein